jgi:predicted nucleic acid-binding protein
VLSSWLAKLQIVDVFSESVLLAYARLDVTSREMGRMMSKNDLWIAAMAMTQDAVLLTLDGDFLHLHPAMVRVEHCRPEELPKGP